MKTRTALGLVVTAGLLGTAAGWLGSSYHLARWTNEFVSAGEFNDLNEAIRVLEATRKGDTNIAAETFEERLNVATISVGGIADETRDSSKRDMFLRALARVRAYRASNPRTSGNPDVDSAVGEALGETNPP